MSQRQNHPLSRTVFATLLTLATLRSFAAGFALIEQSVSGLGNAYAGAAASAEDASTVFFNPAGLMHLEGDQLVAAGHIIMPSADFSGSATNALGAPITGGDGGDAGDTALIPNLYFSRRLPNNFVFGLGINTPFGLKSEYDADWVGRYHAIESELKTININPAIAYQAAPNLSVGVGVNVQYIEATLSQAINQTSSCIGVLLAQNPGMDPATAFATCGGLGVSTADAVGEIEGDDWSYGYNFGLLYDVNAGTRVGFAYRSKVKQELEGDASFTHADAFFTGIGLFVPTDVTAGVTLPETASLSLYHDIDSHWALLADATWTHWNRFQELRVDYASNQPDSVTVEDWDNSMRYSVGLNYRYDNSWLLRTGIAFDEEPIPNDLQRNPRIPGNDRAWLAVGANYRYSSALSFDIGYAHLFVDSTRINHNSASAGTITGEYENAVDILSAQANWTF